MGYSQVECVRTKTSSIVARVQETAFDLRFRIFDRPKTTLHLHTNHIHLPQDRTHPIPSLSVITGITRHIQKVA